MNRWSYGFAARRARQWAAVGLGLVAFGGPALAQWSNDPAVNTVVADAAGEQTLPKVVAAPDGGYYVSWTDAPSGYDIRLQKLDASGHALWAPGGVLVADRSFSFIYDYSLAVDTAGNALLAFHCCENNSADEHIVAQRVSPQGTPLWGAAGLTVSSAGEGGLVARIAGTSDGGAAVAWANATSRVRVQKLDAQGAPQWAGDGITYAPAGNGKFLLADLQASDNGNAIVSFQSQPSNFNRQLWTQKLASADGASLWGASPLVISDNSSGVLQLGYFPPFVDDGAGGAVYVWYVVSGLNGGNVRAQHVDAAGVKKLAANGLDLTTDATQSHYNAVGFYDRASGDIYALWQDVRITPTQRYYGMSAQRVDASGTRAWGDNGRTLLATDLPVTTSQFTALPAPGGGMLAGWVSDSIPNPTPMAVARVAANGDYVWTTPWTTVKTATSNVSRAGGVAGADQAVYVWSDAAADEGDVRVQNLRYDGSLGVSDAIFKSGFE